MANLRFFTTNSFDSAAIVATSSREFMYASKIQQTTLSAHWRSSGLTGDNVKYTFTGNTPITYVSILGHNFGPSMVVYFESSADNFATTAYSIQLTIQENIFQTITPQNVRYYRIRWATGVPIVTSPVTTYIKIGRVWGSSTYTEYDSTTRSDFQTKLNHAFSESAYGVSNYLQRNNIREIPFHIYSNEAFQDFINSKMHTPFLIQKAAFTGGFDETSKNILYQKIIESKKEHITQDKWFYTVLFRDEK